MDGYTVEMQVGVTLLYPGSWRGRRDGLACGCMHWQSLACARGARTHARRQGAVGRSSNVHRVKATWRRKFVAELLWCILSAELDRGAPRHGGKVHASAPHLHDAR
jgi:hypothetical protein